jgi:polyhydroxyalkanoate synthesis regulator phasin
MVDKAREFIPESLKDALKNVIEPLGKAEKAIETAGQNLIKRAEKYDADEMRRIFDDLLAKVRSARGEVEDAFSTGLNKTLQALNMPNRPEIDKIKKDLSKLAKDISALKNGGAAAKKTVRKGR